MDEIPFYFATIEEADTGICAISLVKEPAVEVNWMMFAKEDKKVVAQYSVDKEKHLLTGVIMKAETPIYRVDSDGNPYWVVYTKETIKQMAIKMLNKDITFDNIDTEHNGVLLQNSALELVELYIKDQDKGVTTPFSNVPDGSLIATYKVNDENVWEECLKGTYKGFSLSGMFNLNKISDKPSIDKYNNLINQYMNFKSILKKVLLKYSEVTTEDGTVWVIDGSLVEGATPVDADGNTITDGEYTVGTDIVTVKDGVVESITPKESETEELTEELTEDITEEPTYATTADMESLRTELESVRTTLEELKAKLEEPVVEPITEEYSKVVNTPLKGAARFLSTLN